MNTDRIEKKTVFRAPIARVWRAISDAREFSSWFRIALEGDFAPGAAVRGRLTIPGLEHVTAELVIEQLRPPTYLSYRWHPYAIDPQVDYSAEPMTLVEFQLSEVPEGTQLVITESGFDRLPPGRRPDALRMNDQGWSGQLEKLRQYVASS